MEQIQTSKSNDNDILKPFRPASGSKFVGHTPDQLISPDQKSRVLIDIEKDGPQHEDVIAKENNNHGRRTSSQPFDFRSHDKLNESCMQSLESIISLSYVRRLWSGNNQQVPLLELKENALSLRHGKPIGLDEATKILRYTNLRDLKHTTFPDFLWRLYLSKGMDRGIISGHLKKATSSLKGKGISASSWQFRHLVAFSAIPLFRLELDEILPKNHNTIKEEVMGKIDECFIAQRILKDITIPTAQDLYRFEKGTHMSWYLLNPWFLFFTGLRDLLTRGDSEIKGARNNKSDSYQSSREAEKKHENMSEQLLHRFMEVVLVLFSIISDSRDEYRSTPSRVDSTVQFGKVKCNILDDGYVYMSRSGTSKASDRSRYGHVPIIRYEAKRLSDAPGVDSDVTAQIFSELLSAAVENMKYLKYTDPSATEPGLPEEERKEANFGYIRNIDLAPYHDAFVISMSHYTLRIHTARFPTPYLRWVTEENKVNECKERYCILHKVSTGYDLSEPKARLKAAQDILILLWAIRKGGFKDSPSGIFVARALMKQTILRVESEKNATTSNVDSIQVEETKRDSNQHINDGTGTKIDDLLYSFQPKKTEEKKGAESGLGSLFGFKDSLQKQVQTENESRKNEVQQNKHQLQKEAQANTNYQPNTNSTPGIKPENTDKKPPRKRNNQDRTEGIYDRCGGNARSQYRVNSRDYLESEEDRKGKGPYVKKNNNKQFKKAEYN